MRCASCKRTVPDDAVHCPYCNASLGQQQAQPRPATLHGASVLVVDDDTLVLTLLGKILTAAGYLVATANSYQQAAQHLQQRKFDIVLTDLVMPDPGGLGVVSAARAALPDALVVCMSGRADIALVGAARDAGAEEFLVKPFSPQSVVTDLACMLAGKRQGAQAGMPPDLAALLRSRLCPKCRGSNWRLSPNWSEWSAPTECVNCAEVMFKSGRCCECGQWGIEGETYTEAFGLCERCVARAGGA